ncbi:tyrosine-type recombinase/integrase [Cupriavidus malaysiensis]|uniref:Integrase n=1 Tax=Cupriavidus malaysiensis TaxID=367825 RepID=A0ABM6F5I0_9BURK|nr:tyrosine-type recombinase/integrase [Cupriavidus malaysiensis]AOZ06750.1 integrase [Cupriavidus malaysiensis]
MNARRRTKADGLPSRVYVRRNSFFWVRPTDEKWLKLCRVAEGETLMYERLAAEKRKVEVDGDEGSMSRLVAIYMDKFEGQYSDTFRDEWKRRGEDVRKAFKHHSVEQVDSGLIEDFLLQNWADKLPTQRAMKGWLSKFFAWAVRRRHAQVNPCREVEVKKPTVRDVYIPHDHFMAIRAALASYSYEKKIKGKLQVITAKVPTGPEMQIFVDLCYLTCQRSTEIRLLRWSQVDERAGVIRFKPTKTENSSGQAVDWPITPEIAAVLRRARALRRELTVQPLHDYVITDRRGKPKTAAACRDAWRDGLVRSKLEKMDYVVKDIRAKALTDAYRSGHGIDELQVAGAHADRATTEDYIKQRDVPVSVVRLRLPAA